jgi:translation initiation factor 5A
MSNYKFKSVGSLKKGDYVVIDDTACTVTKVKISRPGKHGHAKVNLTGKGLLDEKKRNVIMPGHDKIKVPVIDKRNAQVLNVTGDTVNVMDMETYENFSLDIPEEEEFQDLKSGDTILYWTILDNKVLKDIKNRA